MEEIQNGGTETLENTGTETTPEVTETSKVEQPAEKTFTQAEVEEIVKKRLARVEKKQAPVEDVVKDLQAQVASYERKLAMKDCEIDDNYREFVEFKVGKMVGDGKDFATALAEYISGEGKKYLKVKEELPKTPRPDNQSGKPQDEMRAYLQAKYNIKI